MQAFLILVFGDIPAISMLMHMKGHNGISPCRWCKIKGVQIPGKPKSPQYVPHNCQGHPAVPHEDQIRNPLDLPMRTHENFMADAHEVASAPLKKDQEDLAKACGIKGVPLLASLSSLSFPHSFPYDFMHLIWENVIKNLFALWTGKYKDLDQGKENHQVPQEDWNKVGLDTGDLRSSIQSAFGPAPFNFASKKKRWTADMRSFWTLYIGPIVLKDCLPAKYYNHFLELVRLLHTCMKWSISAHELAELRQGFAKWVKTYEKCVSMSCL